MASSKATYVCGIAGSDDGFVELESSGDHKGVDGIGGGHASFGQKHAGTLSDRSSEVENRDARVVQEAIDSGVEARPSADFAKYWCWHADKSTAIVRKCQDRPGPVFKNAAQGSASEGIEGLRVEN
jgi:hypothetical protein